MCHADDSRPPALPGRRGPAVLHRTTLRAADGTTIRAAHALPRRRGVPVAALVLPDGRGLHPYYEHLAHELAAVGVEALALDLYGRTAGAGPRGPEFASRDHSARLRWSAVCLDLEAAAARLRAHEPDRPVITIGFCLGGRVSLLAATVVGLRVAGSVAFYPQVVGAARSDLPAPAAQVSALGGPTLTIFGGDDELVPPGDVERWRIALADSGRTDEVLVYPQAPHSFFDRAMDQYTDVCAASAERVLAFLEGIAAVRR